VSSDSRAGQPLAAAFPNLARPGRRRASATRPARGAVRDGRVRALFCAAPHGAAAARIDALLGIAETGAPLTVVDASADFRFRDPGGLRCRLRPPASLPAAPGRVRLRAARARRRPPRAARRPSGLLRDLGAARHRAACLPPAWPSRNSSSRRSPAAPAPAASSARPRTTPSATATCSPTSRWCTGTARRSSSSRRPPAVQGALRAALRPWARGIHATIHGRLAAPATSAARCAPSAQAYAGSPFVEIVDTPPRIKDVSGLEPRAARGRGRRRGFVVLSVHRQPGQGRGRRRAAMDEPPARTPGGRRAPPAGAGMDMNASESRPSTTYQRA
jgi:hypothetical protein